MNFMASAEGISSGLTWSAGGDMLAFAYTGPQHPSDIWVTGQEAMARRVTTVDLGGLNRASFVTPDEYQRFVELMNQRREVAYATFELSSFLDGVEVTDEQIAAMDRANRVEHLVRWGILEQEPRSAAADCPHDVLV